MLFKSIVSAAMVASALAAPLQHQHHQHKQVKKDVAYATQTITVGAGLSPTSAAAAPASTQASSGSDSGSSSAPSGGSSDSSSGSSGAKGITYTPYANDGGCKSSSQIQKEVSQLSGYDVIRLYGVDCDQVGAVLKAKASNQKLFVGIFDVANIEDGVSTIADAVKSNGNWDDIDTVSVGNELVNSGQATASDISGYVKKAKLALSSAGFKGDVVSVDTFIAVINNPALCDASDYVAVNAHAFFDGHYSAQDAGKWVLQQIQRVASTCGDKKVLITETGWPSKGDSNGDAVPSISNQKDAINSIKQECGNDVFIFTAFNDLWKADGPFNAEKYWGVLSGN